MWPAYVDPRQLLEYLRDLGYTLTPEDEELVFRLTGEKLSPAQEEEWLSFLDRLLKQRGAPLAPPEGPDPSSA